MVAEAFAGRDERTRFFSTIDFWVQVGSLTTQLLLFGRLFRWLGLRTLLVSVPVLMAAGYALLALYPQFAVLVAVMMVRRIGEYSITRPSRDTLYTVVSREERYKAKSLIDTFVYRGGDATAASLHALLKTIGLGVSGIAWFGAAIAGVWAVVAWSLGTRGASLRSRLSPPPRTGS
jgi:AAA family ATP:ADP antiporter